MAGVAAAQAAREPVLPAALAGLVAGVLSMAADEYVSVSSQADAECADLDRSVASAPLTRSASGPNWPASTKLVG